MRARLTILYDETELARNRFFADQLTRAAHKRGFAATIVTGASTATAINSASDITIGRTRNIKLVAQIENLGTPVVNPSSLLRVACDKWTTYNFCKELQLPVPKTSLVTVTSPTLRLPVILKPRYGHGGHLVSLVHTRDEFRQIIEANPGVEWIQQEYLSGGDVDRRAYVLDGEVIAVVERTAREDFRANMSRGASLASSVLPKDALQIVERTMSALPRGYYGVDILQGEDGYVLSEIEDPVGSRALYELDLSDPAPLLIDYVDRTLHLDQSGPS